MVKGNEHQLEDLLLGAENFEREVQAMIYKRNAGGWICGALARKGATCFVACCDHCATDSHGSEISQCHVTCISHTPLPPVTPLLAGLTCSPPSTNS